MLRRVVLRRASAVAVAVAVGVGGIEAGLRGWSWVSPGDGARAVLRAEAPGQALEPRSTGIRGSSYRVSTDANGLRAPLHPERKPSGVTRVLTLGCGLTFGEGVDDDASYPARLEALLREEGKAVEVVNAGQPGFTTFQATWLWDRGLARFQPDVVVAGLLLEDAEAADRSDRSLAARAAEAALLAAAPWYRSRAVVLGADALEAVRSALPGTPAGRRVPLHDYAEALAGLHARASGAGARLVLLAPPGADERGASYRSQMHRQAERLGVPMLDLADGQGGFPLGASRVADAESYDAVARAVAQFLVAHRLLP